MVATSGIGGLHFALRFGDGVSTTTNKLLDSPALYYGHRYCNGRVWIEVLAQRQGISYEFEQKLVLLWSFQPQPSGEC